MKKKDLDITDEDIQSLVDGELPEVLTSQVLEAVMQDPRLFRKLTRYLSQKDSLRIWWNTQKYEH